MEGRAATFLGILVDGFPNFLMVMGPHAGLGNFPRAAEYNADWVPADPLRARAPPDPHEATPEARRLDRPRNATSEGLLFTEVDSWMTGINRNVEGKQVRRIMRYSGAIPRSASAAKQSPRGYRELALHLNATRQTKEHAMDVRMMMVFASYGWENCSDAARVGRGNPPRTARGRSRLRLPVVGRAPLQRLLVRARQPPADVVSDGRLSEYRPGHRRGHHPLARPAARRRAGGGARPC